MEMPNNSASGMSDDSLLTGLKFSSLTTERRDQKEAVFPRDGLVPAGLVSSMSVRKV